MTLNLSSISWRSIEKLLAYGAALVSATNGFAQLSLPPSIRNTLLAVSGIVVVGLHLSGPAQTPNTSTTPRATPELVAALQAPVASAVSRPSPGASPVPVPPMTGV